MQRPRYPPEARYACAEAVTGVVPADVQSVPADPQVHVHEACARVHACVRVCQPVTTHIQVQPARMCVCVLVRACFAALRCAVMKSAVVRCRVCSVLLWQVLCATRAVAS